MEKEQLLSTLHKALSLSETFHEEGKIWVQTDDRKVKDYRKALIREIVISLSPTLSYLKT